jgi:hypothetical protein
LAGVARLTCLLDQHPPTNLPLAGSPLLLGLRFLTATGVLLLEGFFGLDLDRLGLDAHVLKFPSTQDASEAEGRRRHQAGLAPGHARCIARRAGLQRCCCRDERLRLAGKFFSTYCVVQHKPSGCSERQHPPFFSKMRTF